MLTRYIYSLEDRKKNIANTARLVLMEKVEREPDEVVKRFRRPNYIHRHLQITDDKKNLRM